MTILICGASHTSGAGLDDRTRAWPMVFEKLSGQPVVSSAIDGASIDYVFYDAVKQVSTHNYSNVIVAWPPLGRTLMVRNENNFLVSGSPMFDHVLYGHNREFKNFLNLYYKHWSNELYDLKFALQKILALQSFLKIRNCQYLFINSDPYELASWLNLASLPASDKSRLLSAFDSMDDAQILAEQDEIKSYVNQLDTNHYHDPVNYNFRDDCYNYDLMDIKTGHPSPVGHDHLANLIWHLWSQL